jgi:hypothetical protein
MMLGIRSNAPAQPAELGDLRRLDDSSVPDSAQTGRFGY